MPTRSKRFQIALSFPGERREFVADVARHLSTAIGQDQVLYDSYYEAEFARPDLDTYLQNLYHDESELIAVFLCADYEEKEWCGLEWRAIRDLIKRRKADSVMPLRFDNTTISGLFSIDGYVWIDGRPPEEIAKLILDRINHNNSTQHSSETDAEPIVNPAQQMATHSTSTSGKYEDGTNVPCGTSFISRVLITEDWHRPSESESTARWKEQWAKLRTRFEQIVDECRPVACRLIDKRIPAYPEVTSTGDAMIIGHKFIQGGGGLGCEPSQLFSREWQPLFGEFAIRDVQGTPMSNSVGEPYGFRYGLSRYFLISAEQNSFGDSRKLPWPHLPELARDGTALLYQLPSGIAESLWGNWLTGFSRKEHSNEYLWFDAIFELSWQRPPGDVLHTKRQAWQGNASITLEGQGLFPRLPKLPFFLGPHPYLYRLIMTIRSLGGRQLQMLPEHRLSQSTNYSNVQIVSKVVIQAKWLPKTSSLKISSIYQMRKFEELVYLFDRGNVVPGRHAAQAERAVELLRLSRSQKDGQDRLRTAVSRIKGETE